MTNYDFSALQTNTTTLLTLVEVTNNATNGLLMGGLIIGAFFLQIALLSKFKITYLGSITYSAWLTFIYTIFFVLAGPGLINVWFLYGFGSLAAIGLFVLMITR